jgi:hypothetical protein
VLLSSCTTSAICSGQGRGCNNKLKKKELTEDDKSHASQFSIQIIGERWSDIQNYRFTPIAMQKNCRYMQEATHALCWSSIKVAGSTLYFECAFDLLETAAVLSNTGRQGGGPAAIPSRSREEALKQKTGRGLRAAANFSFVF